MTLAEAHLGGSGEGVGEGVEAVFRMMGGLEVSELGPAGAERQAAGLRADHGKGWLQLGKHKPGQVEGLSLLTIC